MTSTRSSRGSNPKDGVNRLQQFSLCTCKNKREKRSTVDHFSNGLKAMEFPGPDPTKEYPKNPQTHMQMQAAMMKMIIA